jgi:hypothetical protein
MRLGMYVYPWDLWHEGTAKVAARLRAIGITGVSVSTAYHAGKFLRPHAPQGRVWFPDDGTVYFRPDPTQYGRLRPQAARMVHDFDALRDLADVAPDLRVTGWTVGLHNSRLGALHPDLTSQSVLGDPLVNALCPSHPEVRAYLVALSRDTAAQPGVAEIAIETPGFQTYRHGHHHEFELIELPLPAETLLETCFCPACRTRARAHGIDADRLATAAQARMEAFLADANAPLLDLLTDPDWTAYQDCRAQTVTSLVAEVRATLPKATELAIIPSVQTPNRLCYREGSDLAALARVADRLEVPAYQRGPKEIAADMAEVRRAAGPTAKVGFILRPTWPHVGGAEDLGASIAAARQNGTDRLAFYNYGHMRLQSLDWIAEALKENRLAQT